ncbi:Membrane-bound O-acyltransferase domain-containing protein 2 [Nibea albiflora]|uniref:Membrane-bound O-acyltransferase domain-containing protein 2 n=1 Tax=Nibea albiflora TaxID=240163 RepID=A0ACB7FBK8_NIBAL|nr:Membrane-bound O-acyltransferase domain-containing protein 2 [Nibea albiflora]
MPSLLEYFSYNCNFMGILAGPTSSYNDYIAFIEGDPCRHRDHEANRKSSSKLSQSEPSPNVRYMTARCHLIHFLNAGSVPACIDLVYEQEHIVCITTDLSTEVVRKVVTSFFCLLVFLSVCKVFPVERNIDDDFIASMPFYAQVVYLYLSMLTTRPKYYFVWTLADAINNAAGFGFNGYDEDGSPRWDLISNLRILNIELATSFKVFLDNWNIQTAHWLKRVCYERLSLPSTAATFILSAMWHGAYPGYYLTFLTGIVITLAARAVRHNVRPYFLQSPAHKLVYDVITWAATQIAICYTVVPFVLLSVGPSINSTGPGTSASTLAAFFWPWRCRSNRDISASKTSRRRPSTRSQASATRRLQKATAARRRRPHEGEGKDAECHEPHYIPLTCTERRGGGGPPVRRFKRSI